MKVRFQGRVVDVQEPVSVPPPIEQILAGVPRELREKLTPVLKAAPVNGLTIGALDDVGSWDLQFATCATPDQQVKATGLLLAVAVSEAAAATDALTKDPT